VAFAKRHPRLYLWVRTRSLLLHLLFVSISTGCLFAAWWQIHRAEAGNVLSYFYSVEWPAFVVVGGIGWWQLVHDTDEDIARRRAYHERVRRASAEVVARTLPRSAFALTVDSEEVASRSLPSGGQRPTPALGARSDGAAPPVLAGCSSLAPQAATNLLAPLDGQEEADDEASAYNRYLAYLAVKGKAKTWRNPRGER
jgi:hypothetical protein